MSLFEAKGISILIASTLKPVKDTRAYEKLALSLGETNKYRLNIIGFSSKKPKSDHQIRFFLAMSDYHSRWDRIAAQWRLIKRLFQIRPSVLICCSYEYLWIASFCKRIFGYKLVYDVQENYVANLDLNPNLNASQKNKRILLIQKAESVPGIDLYLLAERCYVQEMPEKSPYLILENKFSGEIIPTSPKSFKGKRKFKFVVAGTLTPAYGILDAVQWFSLIKKAYPESELWIVGHVPLLDFKVQLEEFSKRISGIQLRISTEPIPHSEILESMQAADFALAPYQLHPAILNKYPTKFFECAALGIPLLFTGNPIWEKFFQTFQGGFGLDFTNQENALATFQQALTLSYFSTPVPKEVLWTSEKLHFQEAIQNLLA
ncbi:glycosyltransferase family protein [Algoriphagus mannitolivorans]|uniref:hypothetical protein n=1 Tax=Algoriphagus mannitolivorans TaxID=226504 RepID=UPI0004007055|nr:hypothetical protein [Algoriphagus mannitolivorans]